VARFLISAGWTIESAADTASRQRGIDLVATKRGHRLAVEAKGYPGTVYGSGQFDHVRLHDVARRTLYDPLHDTKLMVDEQYRSVVFEALFSI
jgi:hypothetical protein